MIVVYNTDLEPPTPMLMDYRDKRGRHRRNQTAPHRFCVHLTRGRVLRGEMWDQSRGKAGRKQERNRQ